MATVSLENIGASLDSMGYSWLIAYDS